MKKKQESLDETIQSLKKPLSEILHFPVEQIELLIPRKDVSDDPIKYLVCNSKGEPYVVVLCSVPIAPDLVARGMQNAISAKKKLGDSLGKHVIEPLGVGEINGCSYAILPYFHPLSERRIIGRYQRWRITKPILSWLSQLVATTARPIVSEDFELYFEKPLLKLVKFKELSESIKMLSREALTELHNGKWTPKLVLEHGDFWYENILIQKKASKSWPQNFIIIDWPGAKLEGYAMYDLVRCAQSLQISDKIFKQNMHKQCLMLKCDHHQSLYYLLAALGDIAINLEHMPVKRFVQMSEKCIYKLNNIID